MGFNNADIAKEEDDYVWRGDRNISIYEGEFDKYLIQKVRYTHLLRIHLLTKLNYRVKKNTVRRALVGC
jgi:hypothetical protein